MHLCNAIFPSLLHLRVKGKEQLNFVSTHLSHGGICPFGEPSILSPAKLIQLSIQCFWSINEDSLCSVHYYYTLVSHVQSALDNRWFYPVAFGNQRWLWSSGSYCSSFLFFFFFIIVIFFTHFLKVFHIFIFQSITSTQFCLTVKPSRPKIGLEYNNNIFIYINIHCSQNPLEQRVNKKQGLQTAHTHARAHSP